MSTRNEIKKLTAKVTELDNELNGISHLGMDSPFSLYTSSRIGLHKRVDRIYNEMERLSETLELILAHLGLKRVHIHAHAELHEVADNESENLHSVVPD